MRRISSSATLALKIFFPTLWIVFFGAFTLAILFISIDRSPLLGNWIFKTGIVLFYLLGIGTLYISVMSLKRVELDDEFFYITNYFKTYRYPYRNIEKLVEHDYNIFRIGQIHLVEPGHFGKRITFVESKQKFEDFVKSFPELSSKLISHH